MRNLKRLLLVLAITLTCNNYSLAQKPWTHYSEWMANTQKSYVYKNKDYWRYDDGLMYESILDTYEHYKNGGSDIGDETLKDAVKAYIDKCIDSNGNLLDKYEDNTLDDIRPARMVYKYYKIYGGSNLLTACQTVMNCAAFSDNYRVINHSTGYPWQHKSSYAHQVWLDGIFMGLPYWTLAGPDGVHSSHHTSWTANDYFNDAYNQMQITDEKTYEPEIGLWCHAWDEYFESTTNTPQYWSMKNGKFTTGTFKDYHTNYEKTRHEGRSSHCWGRAAGWFAMAIMETMDNITAVDANYTHLTDLQKLFKKVIDAVWEKRDPTTGMWRCVLDVDDSKGDYKAIKEATERENYLEATCSAMFTYCLLHGVAKGYLPSSYLDKAKSSYQGLINTFITTDGGLKLNNCMEVGGLGGTTTIDETDYDRDGSFAYYTIEKKKANDSKGVGPFIWASLEAEKIGYNMETNSFGPIDENTIVTFAWSKASDEITQGASYTSPTFTAKTYGNDTPLTNSETVDFASDNTSVATVGTNGTVTLAGGTGTAHITAALKTGSYTWSGTTPCYTITVKAPDTTAPTLEGQSITNGTTNVSTSGNIVLTFSEAVACTTNATLTPAGGGTTINLTPTVSGSTVTYSYSGLSNSTSYTFNLPTNSVADLAGNNYASAISFGFTTGAAPAHGASDPATKTLNGITFLDVANTTNNTTITSTNTKCVTYGLYYLGNKWKPSWKGGSSSNFDNTGDSGDFTAQGFLSSAAPESGSSDAVAAATSGIGDAKIRNADSYKHIFYVTGITGVAILNTDENSSNNKQVYINIEEYNALGTSTTDIGTTQSTFNNSFHVTSYTAATLTADKYYKITLTGGNTSNACGKVAQIRFTQGSSSTPPTPSKVDTPVITGTTPFSSSTTATITCDTDGATIHYTTDGSAPTSSSATYSEPINISATTIVKAIAIKSGMTDSDVASATFTKSEGGGGTSATITYNLKVGTSASTTIKNSTSTTDATNITNIDIDQAHDGANGEGASNRTTKLAIKTGNNGETFNNPTNYELFKFTIATGKQFTPSEIDIKVANVGSSSANDIKYKAVLSDESGHSIDGTYIVETQDGTVENFVFANSSNTAFIGNVTLKLWAWQIANSNASAFRMGTPLTITGTIEDSSEPIIPTYTVTATSNNNSWGTVSVDKATAAEGATVTITTSPASGYELTSLTATDGESTPVTITNNQFTMPASNVTVNATFAAMEKVATPSISGNTSFTESTTATITCDTDGATIHYTTDGSAPTSSSATYSEPINISATTTVKAIAVKEGMADSDVASATFTKSGGGGGGSGTVLFSQDFDDATEVAYAASTARTITTGSGNNIVGTDSKTQFSYIGMTEKIGAGIAINSTTGGNSVNATGFFQAYCNATGQNWALVHNTDFADTAPTALKIDMKIYFQQLSSGSDYSVSFAVGDNFENGTSSPTSANVHSGFSIFNNNTAKLCQYLTKTSIYDTGITQGSWQYVTWIINNNGEVLTYTDPKGESSTVNNDCFDLWIGTTKVATNQATTATTALQNLYIGDPAGKKNEFRLDEIVVTDLSPTEVAKVATPEITPDDGTVFESTTQNVSISCSTSGASIYYTLDGTEPTTSSIPYNSAFTIYGTKTVKAIAIKEGMTNSAVATATITNTCLNEYTDGTLLLKEAATDYTPVAATGVDVTLKRTLQANKWNALCLPFDVTPAMFSSATNGATTNLETLKGVNNGIFTFAPTNSVPAGTPFIAKPAANIANPVFEDVEVKAVDAGSDIKDGYTFQGNYTKVTLDPETNLFISMSQQKLVSPTGSNILQGLRGYFIVPSGEGARFSLNFDGEMIVTDINRLNIEHLPFAIDDNTPIYNLSGQRVSKDYKGIVIINGKKFVRK